jgi:hypothetical protein
MLVIAQICALALGLTMIHRFTSTALLSDARTAAEAARADLVEDYQQIGLSGLIDAINYRLKMLEDRNFVALLKGLMESCSLAIYTIGRRHCPIAHIGNKCRSDALGRQSLNPWGSFPPVCPMAMPC